MTVEVPKSFDGLSDEVVVQILHFCTYSTILRFGATCHRYLDLVSNTTSLQLHIQLESSGLEILSGSSMGGTNYPLILNELQRYQSAWLDLDLSPPIEYEPDDLDPQMLLWELREGGYFKAFSSSDSMHPDSLQSISLGSHDLLPSSVNFHLDYHEFTLDPNQELAALVRVDPQRSQYAEVHLRSTANGLKHPLAQHPLITVKLDFAIPWGRPFSIVLEIVDSVLVVKFADVFSRVYDILIWDWTSAILLHKIGSRSGICDFSLLSRDYLVLYSAAPYEESEFLVLQQLRLLVYKISSVHSNCNTSPDVHFDVPSFPTLRPTLTLEFPKLRNDTSISEKSFLLRSDPVPGRILYTSSAAFACPHALTFGLTLSLFKLPGAVESTILRIFVNATHLFEYLQEHEGGETVTVPWDKWGKQSTRWFFEDIEPNFWICWMSGSRYVRATHTPDDEWAQQLSVVDFHTPTVKRSANRTSNTYLSGIRNRPSVHPMPVDEKAIRNGRGLITSHAPVRTTNNHPDAVAASDSMVVEETVDSDTPTVIENLFEEPIESRLPYRIVTKVEPVPIHSGWLIGGNHVIGINRLDGDFTEISIYKLRVSNEE